MPLNSPRPPSVDDLPFDALYEKSEYPVETDDGWRLMVTRYKPLRQAFEQPLFMQPILLVHGFTQNRHCWSAGEFVKNLLYFGIDVHILELRGHGRSSIHLQRTLHKQEGRPLPADIDYDWDVDSYFLSDLPAAVAAVKKHTGQAKIFYCGHSMGGMLGYGYAGQNDDFQGIITIGSPSQLGKGFLPIRLIAELDRLTPGLLAGLRGVDAGLVAWRGLRGTAADVSAFKAEVRFLPFDLLLRTWGRIFMGQKVSGLPWLDGKLRLLYNPKRVPSEAILWLLTWGGEKEPLKVTRQFARWIREGGLKCYRTGYVFSSRYEAIKIPMAIIFGDEDRLANLASTRSIYRNVSSDYLLWRPVRGNSHMELTMGHDIRQICYDIKNLMEYAISHVEKEPSLPRKSAEDRVRTDLVSRKARRLRILPPA
jgi:pimeloyl-ACP methyl ester carboxylesterase